MARMLAVYLSHELVGHLIQDDHGDMVFDYAESWLTDPSAMALSHSLPLRRERYTRRECRGFFAGILPESDQRETIARNLGISAKNDFAMLERIGGDCAGAITFVPSSQNIPERNEQYRILTDHDLAVILNTLPRRPLMAGEVDIRISLAGAQNKIPVHIADNTVSLPLGGAASTHILKPAIDRYDGVVFNEALCMKLSRAVGLPTAKVDIGSVEGIDFLLVERYDRRMNANNTYERLHQEDFCQALGIVPERKYQNEGGPSLKQCFRLLRDMSSVPVIDLPSLLDAVIFNYLVGNNDAHAKNFSLLYHRETTLTTNTRFAPLYDMLCTVYYPELSPKMAMKIGGEYLSDRVTASHFAGLAEEAELGKPMVTRRLRVLAESILTKLPEVMTDHPVAIGIAKIIGDRCKRAISGI